MGAVGLGTQARGGWDTLTEPPLPDRLPHGEARQVPPLPREARPSARLGQRRVEALLLRGQACRCSLLLRRKPNNQPRRTKKREKHRQGRRHKEGGGTVHMRTHAEVIGPLISQPHESGTEQHAWVSTTQATFDKEGQNLAITLAFAVPNQICLWASREPNVSCSAGTSVLQVPQEPFARSYSTKQARHICFLVEGD